MKKSRDEKIKTLSEISKLARSCKQAGKKTVLCFGVFDLIHPGHIRFFDRAKKQGDVLIVAVSADRFVKKGPDRPVFTENLRTEVLSAIAVIDFVVIVPYESAVVVIQRIKPDIYVKGCDRGANKASPVHTVPEDPEANAIAAVGGTFLSIDDIVFSSSYLINHHMAVYPPKTKAFLEHFRGKYTDQDLIRSLTELKRKKILVIGDAIIDEYHYTRPLGKSYKEPIVVHKYVHSESFAGGSLATANHVSSVSENVTLVTLLGKDQPHESFIRKHLKRGVTPHFFYRMGSTIVKRRYIDEYYNQKLFQISFIDDHEIQGRLERSIQRFLSTVIPSFDMVIVSDYGHGLLTKNIIRTICSKSKFLAVNTQANSASFGFHVVTKYSKANLVCIDDMELRLATLDRWGQFEDLLKRVYRTIGCSLIVGTRGPYGSTSYSKNQGLVHVPAFTEHIVDRVGAGDALFSLAAPCASLGLDSEAITFIGNVAAAIKIQTIGNKVPLDFQELSAFITRLLK